MAESADASPKYSGPSVRRSLRSTSKAEQKSTHEANTGPESIEASQPDVNDLSATQSVTDDEEEGEIPEEDSDQEDIALESSAPTKRPSPVSHSKRREVTPAPQKHHSDGPYNKLIWLAAAVAILAFIFVIQRSIFVKYFRYPTENLPTRRCENLVPLRAKYPLVDKTFWSILNVSVHRAFLRDPGEPATFILLYNASAKGEALLEDTIRFTADCAGDRKPIRLESAYFHSAEIAEDYAVFLSKHREQLKSQGILVVHDLDQVPANAAQAFFPICDSYEPLVERAVIFFTMDISRQPEQVVISARSATAIAERILKDLWKPDLPEDALDPLLVRLTENVYKLY